MSIETDLTRIAAATEEILAILKGVKVVEEKPNVVTKSEPVAEIKTEMKKEVEPTEEEMRVAVREYMNATNKEKAIELLVKHGAKAEKPMIKDVTNKLGLMAEIKNAYKTQ